MQENLSPRISSMLAATARRLDPPRPSARRWPKVLAGTALLAAGAAAATAMAMRNRSRAIAQPVPPRKPASSNGGQRTTMLKPNTQGQSQSSQSQSTSQRTTTEPDINGLSRTR